MFKSAKHVAAVGSAFVVAVTGGVVAASSPAMAAACTPSITAPWRNTAGGLNEIVTGGYVHGGCPGASYSIGLFRKVAGVWNIQAESNTFSVGGGSIAEVKKCTSGTWSGAILKNGTEYLSSTNVTIKC